MSHSQGFEVAGQLALVGWFLLLFASRWKHTARLVTSVLLPSILAVYYLWLLVPHVADLREGFSSLDSVSALFDHPSILLAGWLHYLAFDLFVGSWEVRDAQRLGISHGWVIPCLLLTFLAGPVGLLTYLALRWVLRRRLWLEHGNA